MEAGLVFAALRKEGLPLFLSFSTAAQVLGASSEAALRQSWRRGNCPVRVTRCATGALGFALPDVAEFLSTGIPQPQPLLLAARNAIPTPARRGAPKKASRLRKCIQIPA